LEPPFDDEERIERRNDPLNDLYKEIGEEEKYPLYTCELYCDDREFNGEESKLLHSNSERLLRKFRH
jgi:hypothetical protein